MPPPSWVPTGTGTPGELDSSQNQIDGSKSDQLEVPVARVPNGLETCGSNLTTAESNQSNKIARINDEESESKKKLSTPLASMLPKELECVDVTQLFPKFRPGKVSLIKTE